MKKLLSWCMVGGMLIAQCPISTASDARVTLTGVSVAANVITMQLSGETKYHAFTISNPPRIVVEFSNTVNACKKKEIVINGDHIKRVRCGQFKDSPSKISRVVVDLLQSSEYAMTSTANAVVLSLKTAAVSGVAASALKDPGYQQAAAMAAQTPTVPTVYAQPISSPVPFALATPVPPSPDKSRTPSPQSPNGYKVQPTPLQIIKTELPKKLITFDFQDADIRDVFRILALKSGINIIYGADVVGSLTLRLDNVPFDKAFDTILSVKGLIMQDQGGGILRVMTMQRLAEERIQAVTFTKIFPLNYAKADEIKANLDAIRVAEGRKGSVSFDLRTNSLIVTDTPEGFLSLGAIISELDKKPQQVIIEAKIVEVDLNKSSDIGIQWQAASTVKNDSNVQIYNGGSQAQSVSTALGPNAVQNANVVSPLNTSAGGTGVSFPATAVSGEIASIAFGLVTNQGQLTGLLSALAQKGLSKLLSSPKVTTINNQEAKIMVGQKIPYTTTTVSVSGSTQQTNFLDVGIKLTVTPTINSDQRITLNVHPEVSLYVRADPAGPVIGTREAMTTVIVNNGDTVVIGGLITDQDIKSATQVPLLGDLPVIGQLFRENSTSKARTELLVFITPQILNN
ncbi:MAG: type IV pilus secretin PilQ [Endomicrobiales bacterium]